MSASRWGALFVCACLLGGLGIEATATIPEEGPAEEFSPLFARRLEVGLRNMDKPPDRVYLARLGPMHRDVATPASGNPISACLGSACFMSVCIGSACFSSTCFGSACFSSNCGGSGCITSGCVGSTCVGSGCAGSVCVGSICFGSACLNCPDPGPPPPPPAGAGVPGGEAG